MHFATFISPLKILYIPGECFYHNSNIEIFNMIKVATNFKLFYSDLGTNFKLFNKVLYCFLSLWQRCVLYLVYNFWKKRYLRLLKIIWLFLGPKTAAGDCVGLDSCAVRLQSLVKWHTMNLGSAEPRVPSPYRNYPMVVQLLLCNSGSICVEWFPRHWCPCLFSKVLLPCENS